MTEEEIEEIVVWYVADFLLERNNKKRRAILTARLNGHDPSDFYKEHILPVITHLVDFEGLEDGCYGGTKE